MTQRERFALALPLRCWVQALDHGDGEHADGLFDASKGKVGGAQR